MDDMIQTSPWAWLGWVVAAIFALLFGRLWHSLSGTSMRKMQDELDEARIVIGRLRGELVTLTHERDELREQVGVLTGRCDAVLEANDRLGKANHVLRVGLTGVAKQLKEEKKLRDAQYGQLIKLMGDTGRL